MEKLDKSYFENRIIVYQSIIILLKMELIKENLFFKELGSRFIPFRNISAKMW